MWSALAFVIKSIEGASHKTLGGHAKLNDALLKHSLVLHGKHYYAPFVSKDDIRQPLTAERYLPGLKLDAERMLQFLSAFDFQDELRDLPDRSDDRLQYGFINGTFGPGDAEILYGMIRHLKPRRFIEIGAGNSTLVAQLAIRRNAEEGSADTCRHICVEPFENPWLEQLGIEVIRKKVEELPLETFKSLGANDILFVDSSHTVRPQGDVLFEILEVFGSLEPGVYVHVHDIFTPFDYPEEWILERRAIWHEQYLLEAFLSFNNKFEVICALNWLYHTSPGRLRAACPVLTERLPSEPGSFWFRTV